MSTLSSSMLGPLCASSMDANMPCNPGNRASIPTLSFAAAAAATGTTKKMASPPAHLLLDHGHAPSLLVLGTLGSAVQGLHVHEALPGKLHRRRGDVRRGQRALILRRRRRAGLHGNTDPVAHRFDVDVQRAVAIAFGAQGRRRGTSHVVVILADDRRAT